MNDTLDCVIYWVEVFILTANISRQTCIRPTQQLVKYITKLPFRDILAAAHNTPALWCWVLYRQASFTSCLENVNIQFTSCFAEALPCLPAGLLYWSSLWSETSTGKTLQQTQRARAKTVWSSFMRTACFVKSAAHSLKLCGAQCRLKTARSYIMLLIEMSLLHIESGKKHESSLRYLTRSLSDFILHVYRMYLYKIQLCLLSNMLKSDTFLSSLVDLFFASRPCRAWR